MGPPTNVDGEGLGELADGKVRLRFNGAADKRRRRAAPNGTSAGVAEEASMGPPTNVDGETLSMSRTRYWSPGFNGAADKRRRRDDRAHP